MKKIAALLLALVLALSVSGCAELAPDYDAAGYISALLKNNYQNDSADYIGFSGATEAEALENHNATIQSGANRFCAYFGISLTDEQQLLLDDLMQKSYGLAKYTVQEQTETASGYIVRVAVEPLTSFSALTDEIFAYKRTLAADAATGESEASDVSELEFLFATHVLTACSDAIAAPRYGEAVTIVFEINQDKSGNLSIDMLDFDRVDEAAIAYG